jgi:geranylgeranyl diphosphate synthase type II
LPRLCDTDIDAATLRRHLQNLLDRNAPAGRDAAGKLAKCLASALNNSGSLFRAELAFRSGDAHQLDATRAEAIACSLEYFHLASLLLDDLPMMDDSMERRGQVCAHLLFGEGTAVLAALALITRAYGMLGEAIATSPLECQRTAHGLIERSLGILGIINGQALDLEFCHEAGKGMGPKQIAVRKTAPLIELALALPATLAGAGRVHLRKLRRLSICWGLLYQGLDDVADALLTVERSGKTTGRDDALGRPNIFHQLGRARTFRYLDRLIQVARGCIDDLHEQNERLDFMHSLLNALVRRRVAFSES